MRKLRGKGRKLGEADVFVAPFRVRNANGDTIAGRVPINAFMRDVEALFAALEQLPQLCGREEALRVLVTSELCKLGHVPTRVRSDVSSFCLRKGTPCLLRCQ